MKIFLLLKKLFSREAPLSTTGMKSKAWSGGAPKHDAAKVKRSLGYE